MFTVTVPPVVSPAYAVADGVLQPTGSLASVTVPAPVRTGTCPTLYIPDDDVVTAPRALPPEGVTVTLALAIPLPRLLVTVPPTDPPEGPVDPPFEEEPQAQSPRQIPAHRGRRFMEARIAL
jgi:hypothetical protein